MRTTEGMLRSTNGRVSACTLRLLPFERFVDEHDWDVAHNRVDPAAFDAAQTLFDDRFFPAELVAVFVANRRLSRIGERGNGDLFLTDRTSENFEEFCVDGHGGESVLEN